MMMLPSVLHALFAVTTLLFTAVTPAEHGCATYDAAYGSLTREGAVRLASAYDWSPYSAETVVDVFHGESGLAIAAYNRCSHDYGWVQLNQVHEGSYDMERVRTDPFYAVASANDLYWRARAYMTPRAAIGLWYASDDVLGPR